MSEQPPTNNIVKDVPAGLNQNIAARWQILSMQSRGGYKNRGQGEEWPNLNVFRPYSRHVYSHTAATFVTVECTAGTSRKCCNPMNDSMTSISK